MSKTWFLLSRDLYSSEAEQTFTQTMTPQLVNCRNWLILCTVSPFASYCPYPGFVSHFLAGNSSFQIAVLLPISSSLTWISSGSPEAHSLRKDWTTPLFVNLPRWFSIPYSIENQFLSQHSRPSGWVSLDIFRFMSHSALHESYSINTRPIIIP